MPTSPARPRRDPRRRAVAPHHPRPRQRRPEGQPPPPGSGSIDWDAGPRRWTRSAIAGRSCWNASDCFGKTCDHRRPFLARLAMLTGGPLAPDDATGGRRPGLRSRRRMIAVIFAAVDFVLSRRWTRSRPGDGDDLAIVIFTTCSPCWRPGAGEIVTISSRSCEQRFWARSWPWPLAMFAGLPLGGAVSRSGTAREDWDGPGRRGPRGPNRRDRGGPGSDESPVRAGEARPELGPPEGRPLAQGGAAS